MGWEARIVMALGVVLACGPQVELEDAGSGTGTGSSVGTSTTMDPSAEASGSAWLDLPAHCSTVEQDCPQGYKCMPYSDGTWWTWNATRCVSIVNDPRAVGEPCTVTDHFASGLDDCDGSSMCRHGDLNVLAPEGACMPFCVGTDDEPGCADACDFCQSIEGIPTVCLDLCDPFLQDCGPGEACYPYHPGVFVFACMPEQATSATLGQPCDGGVCPPGQLCEVSANDGGCGGWSGCCRAFCSLEGPDPCPELQAGTHCDPMFSGEALTGCDTISIGMCRG